MGGLAKAGIFKRRTRPVLAGHGADIGMGGKLEARGDQGHSDLEL